MVILMNKFFKWASICNFIFGGFILFISLMEYSSVLLGVGMVQLVLGLYYLQCSHQDVYTMYQNRISVLLLGIVNFIPNFIKRKCSNQINIESVSRAFVIQQS